jgi:hypothetical protein
MPLVATLAVMMIAAVGDPPQPDSRTIFAQWETYCSAFKDVAFVYEGTMKNLGSKEHDPDAERTFQGYYAFRNDGATLIDVFDDLGAGGRPGSRQLFSLLDGRMETLDASPDFLPRVRDREPVAANGGAGSLNRPNAPERIFLAWFLHAKCDPTEYELQPQGWEDIEGHRCLEARMPGLPRSQAHQWQGEPPFYRLWLDPERGCYPLRWEYSSGGEEIGMRIEILHLERVALPDGRLLWFPREGRTWTYGGTDENGRPVTKKEPTYLETHRILTGTVTFDQGLNDAFFSVKRHALVASHEDLKTLQRELERAPVKIPAKAIPSDPESVRKRLDESLAEADRQAQRLEASSAAREGAGWGDILPWGLGITGGLILLGVVYRSRSAC